MLKTIQDATTALLKFVPKTIIGQNYTLDCMQALLAFLGNPQEKLRVIHVAGTSGKTSTLYFLRGLLEANGKRTGLTISPHITDVTERVQIAGKSLEVDKFLAYLNEFLPLVEKSRLHPSYFEVVVAFAFWVFEREKVDYALIETGLGGLLDATNTVTRPDKLCIITDIGLDHTEILGETLPEIAAQKAGIIQPGNHVIVQEQASEIMDVFMRTAERKKAELEVTSPVNELSLPGFQRKNWALAVAAYNFVAARDNLPVLSNTVRTKASAQTPPGRMEIYAFGDKTIVLDGAHNPQKLSAFSEALLARGKEPTAVLANLIDAPEAKITAALEVMSDFTNYLIIPEFSTGQDFYARHSVVPEKFAERACEAGIKNVEICAEPSAALRILLARPEKLLVITGSLYLVSAVRPLLLKLHDIKSVKIT